MPHINRIRVNNVKYNFGTQYYDDFLMRFSGKNTIYDLANGGGKSVLMLLLFQNLIPNCTLDEKQPIEKLFRTNEGSKTIHSMIEWKLSDVHIKENYKYMLTGFCARKAKESDADELGSTVRDNASVEYFNYCIFYREYNDNDIKNLPLVQNGQRITYNGLKNYLRELERKDLGLVVKIFDRKNEYQRFISEYGLYESEWEIIRGINKTEGHVRTYFETNYKTTRKVVEDLLIEEIIEKSFMNKYAGGENDNMAKTLLDIKDKLIELSKKKDEMSAFDRQKEIIEGFAGTTSSIKNLYFGKKENEQKVARIYNTIMLSEDKYSEKREALLEQLEFIRQSEKEAQRLRDSAVVLGDMKSVSELNLRLESLEKESEVLKDRCQSIKAELIKCESINDYLDYISYKKEAEVIKEILSARRKDGGALMEEVADLAGEIYERNKEKLYTLENELCSEQEIFDKEIEANRALSEDERSLSNELAVLRDNVDTKKTEYEMLNGKLGSYMADAGIIVAAGTTKKAKDLQDKITEYANKVNELKEESDSIREKETRTELDMVALSYRQKQIEREIEKALILEEELREQDERFKKINEVYAGKKIETMLTDVIRQITELEDELKYIDGALNAAKEGKCVAESDDVKEIIDYIERYHGFICKSGADYLRDMSDEERESLINRVPFLPYAVIITDKFQNVLSDTKIMEWFGKKDGVVFLIDEKALNDYETLINQDGVIVATKKRKYMYNDKTLVATVAELTEKKAEYENKLLRLMEYVEVIRSDYAFMETYEEKNHRQEINRLKDELLLVEEDINANKSRKAILAEDKKICQNSITELENRILELEKEKELYEVIASLYEKTQEFESELKELEIRISTKQKNYSDLSERLKAKLNQNEKRGKLTESLQSKIKNINDTWENRYKIYYKGGITTGISGSYDEITAKMDGLIAAIKDENSDLADKEKLVNNYEASMKKTLSNIKYRGSDLRELEEEYEKNMLIASDEKKLQEIKDDLDKASLCLENKYMEIDDVRSKRDKSEGGINHAIKQIEDKYGAFNTDGIPEDNIREFIAQKIDAQASLGEKEKALQQTLKEQEDNSKRYELIKENIERIIENGKINVKQYDGVMEDGVNLYEESKEIAKVYDEYVKKLYEKRQEFESNKKVLTDTLKMIGATLLADEIDKNIIMPESVEDTNSLIERLGETIRCIELEKDSIGKGIEDMERIKDNFENQCVQNCIKIKTELERFPKLSKINIDGENISIIDLKIPYANEESYKDRMESYVNETVMEADNIENMEDKLKYIRNRLTWKKLFSVIVTDMNGIRLKLYKRERVIANSRFLPYEEAVGSTGQSQGIYIQFLIAVINYISSVNSRGVDAGKLKKVIFIDNPFGAAKDVYIWEPIFELLKTNNVQLVVPARGATPAITGRFDVNYVLGQKLVNGKQQTVVVDYFSNVDNTALEYTTLSYEQTSMF